MRVRRAAVLLAVVCVLAGCKQRPAAPPNHTAVLGSYGAAPSGAEPPLTDAQGQPIPRPAVPPGAHAQVVRSGDTSALAVWVQDGHVFAASYDRGRGWGAAQPLEQIYGEASDVQVASNGHGMAMALWRHTVGEIQSVRYSRFDAASGWSTPDVVPGAVPRPHSGLAQDAPRLQMDAHGNVVAQWPSALGAGEVQVARYAAGQGWLRTTSERLASLPPPPHAR
jgi:hypothetical protein